MKLRLLCMPAFLVILIMFCYTATAQVTGTALTYAEYNGGKFILQEDGKWKEFTAKNVFTYKETKREDAFVYLYDAVRKVKIQFNMDDKVIYYADPNTNWIKLYDITAAQDVPYGYTKCCDENGVIEVPPSGKYHLAYGANGRFVYLRYMVGKITFNNKRFGDPVPGIPKAGYYKLSPTQARSESGD